MNSNKSLFALGLEYDAAAEKLKECISARKEKLRLLKTKSHGREIFVMQSELRTLYLEYLETRRTAEYLKRYYEQGCRISGGDI